VQKTYPLLSELLKAGEAGRQLVESFPGPLGLPNLKEREDGQARFSLPPLEQVEGEGIEVCEHFEKGWGLKRVCI